MYVHIFISLYVCTRMHECKHTYTHQCHTRAVRVMVHFDVLFCDMTYYRQAIETLS